MLVFVFQVFVNITAMTLFDLATASITLSSY